MSTEYLQSLCLYCPMCAKKWWDEMAITDGIAKLTPQGYTNSYVEGLFVWKCHHCGIEKPANRPLVGIPKGTQVAE